MRVLRAFQAAGLEYVLIGAGAMAFHGVVRATEDLDLFIRATPENVERLRAALRAVYQDDPNINEISSEDLLGDYPAVRYCPPTGDLYFDVRTRLGEVANFETTEAETKEVDGIQIKVATPSALLQIEEGHCSVAGSDGRRGAARTVQLKGRELMPVEKFRSIEDMNKAPVRESQEPPFERFLRLCARYWAIAPKRYPRGVFKFRTIEEAQKAREKHVS